MNSCLTSFGQQLSNASKQKLSNFDTSTTAWPDLYNINYQTIKKLKQTLLSKPNVLVVGAGHEPQMKSISRYSENWLKTGVHWTNFHPDIQVDIITSTHTCTLEACHYFHRKPLLLIHGVYSKVPPILENSMTIRWSDPFMNAKEGSAPSALLLEKTIKEKSYGVAPYIPSIRNTLFLNTMVMIWLGAKKIVFAGVNPHDPQYFFSGNDSLLLEIVRCLSQCDPWLAEWDGRNERLISQNKDTSNRIQTFISNVLTRKSAVGNKDYIYEFDRGFSLLRGFAKGRGVELAYMGNSSYMASTGLSKIV